MANTPLYTPAEFKEIERFLQDSYIEVADQVASARARNPAEAVQPELERLKQQLPTKLGKKLTVEDLAELMNALQGPFAQDLQEAKEAKLRELEKSVQAKVSVLEERSTFAKRFAKSLITEFCRKKPVQTTKDGSVVITAATLITAAQALGVAAVFAPIVIWLLTKARDLTVPALCAAAGYVEELPLVDSKNTTT